MKNYFYSILFLIIGVLLIALSSVMDNITSYLAIAGMVSLFISALFMTWNGKKTKEGNSNVYLNLLTPEDWDEIYKTIYSIKRFDQDKAIRWAAAVKIISPKKFKSILERNFDHESIITAETKIYKEFLDRYKDEDNLKTVPSMLLKCWLRLKREKQWGDLLQSIAKTKLLMAEDIIISPDKGLRVKSFLKMNNRPLYSPLL